MNLETLAAPFSVGVEGTSEDDAEELTDMLAQQYPETGGQSGVEAAAEAGGETDEDEEQGIEALLRDERERLNELMNLIDRHEERLPEHVAEWKQEALELTGEDDLDEVVDALAD